MTVAFSGLMAILMRTSAGSWNVGNAQRVGSTRKRYWACSTRTLAGRQAEAALKRQMTNTFSHYYNWSACWTAFSFTHPPSSHAWLPPSQLLLLSSRNRRSWRRHIDNCRSILYTLLTCQINTHVNMYVCVWGSQGGCGRRSCVRAETKDNVAWH